MNASRRVIDSGLLAKAGRSVQSGAFDKKRDARLMESRRVIDSGLLEKAGHSVQSGAFDKKA